MPQWRCPHCATPQPIAARCWVCRRSSTSCSTCRHFRTSVAVSVGYCGLDRARLPLRGDEIRECWEEGVAASLAHDTASERAAELPVVDAGVATAAAEGSLGL